MLDRRAACAGMLIVLCAPESALAAPRASEPPRVIEAGPAVPVSVYSSQLVAGEDQPGVLEGITFPIRCRLKPGRLLGPVRVLDAAWMTQPILLLGSDPASEDFLKQHSARLHAMAAVCLVMNAESPAVFKHLQRLAQSLPLAPGPDGWLENELVLRGVTVLPVLIQLDGVAVQYLGGQP